MSIEENGHTNGEIGEVASREDSTAEHSFDELARGVGTGTVSRGKALRVLVASLLGGAFVATAGAAGAAPKPGGTGCPKPGQVRDPQNKGKCICASGLTTCVNGACIDPNTCGGGQTVNTTTCQCECASGRVFCGGQCINDPQCGADQILVADENGDCSCQCRNENKVIDPISGECVCNNICTNPDQTPNPTTCACECPSGEVACGNECVSNTCPQPDQFFDPSTCGCACKNENKVIDPISGECVCNNICTNPDQTPNPTTCACECPSGEVACSGLCIPEPSCGTGQFFDTNSCSCQCRNENKVIDPISGECVCNNICTNPDQTPNPTTCACECPSGEVACGNECVSNTCPAGQTFSNSTCQCVSTCGVANCEGCCGTDTSGDPICRAGNTDAACGTGGGTCVTCGTNQQCSNGQCEALPCNATTCATGCCQNGVCMPGTTLGACGSGGGTCVTCGTNQQCCVTGRDAGTCRNGCRT